MELRGKHVLITGSSSGIGRQLAIDLIRHGARITSFERGDVKASDVSWRSLQVDVRKEEDVRKAFDRIDEPIDILINNAGVMRRAKLLDYTAEEFDLMMETHVKGSWLVLKYAFPLLTNGATVVQMSSRHALGLPENPALYGLSKRAAMDLASVFAKTYPQFTVKVLCPGPVDTPLAHEGETPAGWLRKKPMMKTPAEISGKIIELLESDTKSRLLFDTETNTYFLE